MIVSLSQYSFVVFFILRLIIGIIFIYHAIPKLKNAKVIGQGMGHPAWMIVILGLAELLPSIALIVGVYVQIATLILSLIMIGAIYLKIVKWHVPFSTSEKMGWEFDLLLLAINAFIFIVVW